MEASDTISFRKALEAVLEGQRSDERLKGRMNASLDLQVLDCDEEHRQWAEYAYDLKEMHLNPYDGIHGGVICALTDTCGGVTIAVAAGRMPSTTDLSCSYLRPMNGQHFRIRVELTLLGNRLAGCSCSVYDRDSDKLLVTSMLKYILLDIPTKTE
ncbi:MAG: PaaI family thioesterase [Lachnospiraceae bacterium]|nr:PaaI family thioesterase [Lachnospiraceae bacterium]